MNLEYFNCPAPQPLDPGVLPEPAEFLKYVPDFANIERIAAKYQTLRNLLVIGNGGSINSFIALHGALKGKSTKNVFILSTVDPDYIDELKRKLSANDTLVLSISKSGENTTQLESTAQFAGYPMLIITGQGSPFYDVGRKLGAQIIEHPYIGGRFTGFTEVALLPAALCGLDAQALYKGGREEHELYQQDNQAWKAASILWQLEQKGVSDVFTPIYSHYLAAAGPLITQLCHESFGKDGKGQTYITVEGPEWQHHTTQRFFGRSGNAAACFVSVENFLHPTATHLSPALHSLKFKGQPLVTLDKIPLEKALSFEWEANLEDAKIHNIPSLHLSLTGFAETEIGRFIAFWQLYAVYGSVLRGVNPFDQPEVEASKRMSFDKRLQFKGLL